MTSLVDPSSIEKIVGVKRHLRAHYGRASSAEQEFYILHSQQCLDSGIDLRDCRFSVALDRSIKSDIWKGLEDQPVVLQVRNHRLTPATIGTAGGFNLKEEA